MKLFYECPNCNIEDSFTSFSSTRIDFAMDNGDVKSISCSNCGINHNIHVNDVFAKESKIALITSVLFFLIAFPALLYFSFTIIKSSVIFGGFLFTPFIIYTLINRDEQNRIRNFNKTFISNRNK